MKKTPTPTFRAPMGRKGQSELLPFSRARARKIRGVLRATPYRVQGNRPRNRITVTPRQFGRYQVLQKLGQGTMSAVFLARDPFLSRLVAVKVMHPDLLLHRPLLERFFMEAKAVSRLHSPHIVGVHDLGLEGRTPYQVMEFIDGQTLQKIMDQLQGKPMDPIVACALIVQVLDGLAVASEAGIVHRDLKPANIMLTQAGYLKVTDFGICHLKDHNMTATGEILGPPRFMSPEQVRGLKPITFQSDLFSIGAVFYYLLSGKAPFTEENKAALFRQIVEEPHPPLSVLRPGLDRNLVRWVDALLDKDPAKRGAGAAALALQIKTYLLKKKVAAPVDRIGRYVRDLSAAGFQTTSALSPEQVREWMGSLNLKSRPSRTVRRKRMAVVLIVLLVIGALGSLTTSHIFLSPIPTRERIPSYPLKSEVVEAPQAVSFPLPRKPPLRQETEAPLQDPVDQNEQATQALVPSETTWQEPKPTSPEGGSSLLTIESVPPFAEIFLNGRTLGRTPMEGKQIPSGHYRLAVKSQIGRSVDTSVWIKPGSQSFRFVFFQNPESAP
jgi:eukaryotic-like serine/threonine-protein kinase